MIVSPQKPTPHYIQQKERGLLSVFLICLIVIIIMIFIAIQGNGYRVLQPHILGLGFDLASLGSGVWILLLIYIWWRKNGRLDIFELPVWFSLNVYFQMIFNIFVLQRDISLRSQWLTNSASHYFITAIFMLSFGVTTLWIWYAFGIKVFNNSETLLKRQNSYPNKRITFSLWLFTLFVSIWGTIMGYQGYLPSQGGGALDNYFYFFNLLGDLTVFILLLNHFKNPTNQGWIWMIVLIVTKVVLGLIIGSKLFVMIFVYALMAMYYSRKSISLRLIMVGAAIIIVSIPIVNYFRENLFVYGYSRNFGAGFRERIPILLKTTSQIFDTSFADLFKETRDTFELRQGSILEISAAVIAAHPKYKSYIGVQMVEQIVEQIIPRFLWPGKPVSHPELYYISTGYLGAQQEISFAEIGQISDAYRVGGYLFILFWMFIMGFCSAWLYVRGPLSKNYENIALYLVFIADFFTYNGDILVTSIRILQFGVIVWFITSKILYHRRFEPSC